MSLTIRFRKAYFLKGLLLPWEDLPRGTLLSPRWQWRNLYRCSGCNAIALSARTCFLMCVRVHTRVCCGQLWSRSRAKLCGSRFPEISQLDLIVFLVRRPLGRSDPCTCGSPGNPWIMEQPACARCVINLTWPNAVCPPSLIWVCSAESDVRLPR